MNLVLFSTNGIHYEEGVVGAIQALYVPRKARTQTFADIPNPDTSSVKERYGEAGQSAPLWRIEGPFVKVYGDIEPELVERRNSVEVYLPQDFVAENCQCFYQVFGDHWLVFGAREVSENGLGGWGVSVIDCSEEGVVDFVVSSVSERMLSGGGSGISVAVYNNDDLKAELGVALEPFSLKVQNFEPSKVAPGLKPLYSHRDYGVLMLTSTMFSIFLLIAAIVYAVLTFWEFKSVEKEVAHLDEEIRKIQHNKKLGHIRNPKEVLDFMESSFVQPPSAAIDAAARVGAQFGTVSEIVLSEKEIPRNKAGKAGDSVIVHVKVVEDLGLLLDQEQIAKALLNTYPWVMRIERGFEGGGINLKVEVKVK